MTKRQATTTVQKKTRGKYSKSACQACRKAHVKCILSNDGGRPCERCTKKGTKCIEQMARRSRRERRSTAKVENFAQTELKSFSSAGALVSAAAGGTPRPHNSISSVLSSAPFSTPFSTNATLPSATNSPRHSKMLIDPAHLSTFNPEIYPNFDSMNQDTQNRLRTLFSLVSQQHHLLAQSMSEISQLKQKIGSDSTQNGVATQPKSASSPFSATALEEDFARCFSSAHLPVLVLDRSRALSFFSSNVDMFAEGSIFCNQAFGQMLRVDISKFTSPNFSHQNIGTWAWNRVMSSNHLIEDISKLIFENQVEYAQFKSLLQDAHGHHFFVNAKVHMYSHFTWIVFEPAAFIDDELQLNQYIHHSTKKFRDINQWRDWVTQPNSLAHILKWMRTMFAPPEDSGSATNTGTRASGSNMPQSFAQSLSTATESPSTRTRDQGFPNAAMPQGGMSDAQRPSFHSSFEANNNQSAAQQQYAAIQQLLHAQSVIASPQSALASSFPPNAPGAIEEHSRSRDSHLVPSRMMRPQNGNDAASDNTSMSNGTNSLMSRQMSAGDSGQNGIGTTTNGVSPSFLSAVSHNTLSPGNASNDSNLIHSPEMDSSAEGLAETRSTESNEDFYISHNLLEDGDVVSF